MILLYITLGVPLGYSFTRWPRSLIVALFVAGALALVILVGVEGSDLKFETPWDALVGSFIGSFFGSYLARREMGA